MHDVSPLSLLRPYVPFAYSPDVAAGLVSGLGRQVKGITGRVIRDVVQTDAAINPGNSGKQ